MKSMYTKMLNDVCVLDHYTNIVMNRLIERKMLMKNNS